MNTCLYKKEITYQFTEAIFSPSLFESARLFLFVSSKTKIKIYKCKSRERVDVRRVWVGLQNALRRKNRVRRRSDIRIIQ